MSGGGDCLLFDPTKRNHADTKVFCESKEKLHNCQLKLMKGLYENL